MIVDRFCPKCASNRVYIDEEMFACRTCGNRWRPDFKPYKKVEDEEMAIRGECINCGRDGLTLPQAHMCGGCNARIKKMVKDSPKYKAALAQAKKDFNDPDYKSGRGGNRKTKKLSPDKINKIKTCAKALSIKHNGGNPNTAGIVAAIDMQIIHHQDMIGKLKQAKEILL